MPYRPVYTVYNLTRNTYYKSVDVIWGRSEEGGGGGPEKWRMWKWALLMQNVKLAVWTINDI